jgi:hypothetical protein
MQEYPGTDVEAPDDVVVVHDLNGPKLQTAAVSDSVRVKGFVVIEKIE